MGTFYDEWLRYWDDENEERAKARKCLHEEEFEWVRTKQDFKAALLCSRLNGFSTSGDIVLGEIPRNWHTGQHSHGEEAMYVLEGQGFSVIDSKRYEWDAGSCLFIPFGAVHQHFNSGTSAVRYISGMAVALERFAGLAKVMQYEEAGETYRGQTDSIEPAESDVHPEHGRILLRSRDAALTAGVEAARRMAEMKDEFHATVAKEMKAIDKPAHHAGIINLMDSGNGFKAREVSIYGILVDEPGKNSGRHAHMEAVLYVLQGEGYSVVDGERMDWRKGSVLHVPGPQTVHQHVPTGDTASHMLRIHFGLRYQYFQAIAGRTFPYVYFESSTYD